MGHSLPIVLTRIATLVVAGLLLFAVFGRAHAQDERGSHSTITIAP
jgi:hypothetical protein